MDTVSFPGVYNVCSLIKIELTRLALFSYLKRKTKNFTESTLLIFRRLLHSGTLENHDRAQQMREETEYNNYYVLLNNIIIYYISY